MSSIPSREKAESLLEWADNQNKGPWVQHSKVAARAAEVIANACGLDANRAYILGLLHDIGRFEGVRALHHAIAGYNLMMDKGYSDVARICLTHSFPIKPVGSFSGKLDCTETELNFLSNYLEQGSYIDTLCQIAGLGKPDCTEDELNFLSSHLEQVPYDDYDKLIQLCDALALPSGITLVDTRLIDVALRHGFNDYTTEKWKAFYEIKAYFDTQCGKNIYTLFREEIENSLFN